MPRTAITPVTATGPYPSAGVNYGFTACDAANDNKAVMSGRTMLLFKNSGASSRVVNVTSAVDEKGRLGDITFTLAAADAAGDEKLIGPLPQNGWMQTSGDDTGSIQFDAAHAEVLVLVIALP